MDIIYRISGVQFSLLSPEEILKQSVVEVTKPLTYENGRPVPGGLNDPKMGVIEYGEKCKTCHLDQERCPGHFGHIDLVIPVFNIQFLSGTRMGNSVSIKNILECICIRCAKLLIDTPDNISQIRRKARASHIKKVIGSNKTCRSKHGCGTIQPKITFGKLNRCEYVYGIGKKATKERLSPEYVVGLFKKIDNKTVKILGMDPKWTRPEWMILTRLPVPPPALRPSIKSETTKSEDDLVIAYESIIKTNDQLRRAIEQGNQKVIQTYEDLLNLYINSMVSGKSTATGDALVAFSTAGKPLKSVKDRISAKDGRMRGNLMGKRVDYSARTVITPEPNISVDELGVPIEIAMTLTFPEIVTKDNQEEMYRLVRNGPNVYPGANAIKQKNGSTKTLKYVDVQNLVLQEGDTIERHIIDGDIVLFNRQPSLHKMSMMGHRVVVLPEKTFRLNPSACISGNSLMHTELGSVKIKDFDINTMKAVSMDKKTGELYYCNASKFYKYSTEEYGKKCYKITTETGHQLIATSDHPFFTKDQERKECGKLTTNDHILINNESLPPIDLDTGIDILTDKDIENYLITMQKAGETFYWKSTVKTMKENGLYNIKKGTVKQKILAGLVGHMFGDGTLWWDYKGCHITFRGNDERDIKEIKKDLEKLGIQNVKYYYHKLTKDQTIIKHNGDKIQVKAGCGIYEIDLRKRAIAFAFNLLGVPQGDKIIQEFTIPDWIKKGSKLVKREFLRGYFGTDSDTPRLNSDGGKSFYSMRIRMSKEQPLTPKKFFNDLKTILLEFSVKTSDITKTKGNLRKSGKISECFQFRIQAKSKNLIRFFEKIGYLYAKNRSIKGKNIAEYLRYKILKFNNARYAKNFNDYIENNRYEKNEELIWTQIISIKEINISHVYDVTMSDKNHNFTSQRIITHNCNRQMGCRVFVN